MITNINEYKIFLENASIKLDREELMHSIVLPTGYTLEFSDNYGGEFIIKFNDKQVGDCRFGSVETFQNKKYISTQTVWLDSEHKRKGIYKSIILATVKYVKSIGLDGVISNQFDTDSGEFERSTEANIFWDGLVAQGLASKIEYYDSDVDEDLVAYITK